MIGLEQIARDLARAWELADAAAPPHPTYGKNGSGIGPFEEQPFMRMLREQLLAMRPTTYVSQLEVPYLRRGETADFCFRRRFEARFTRGRCSVGTSARKWLATGLRSVVYCGVLTAAQPL
jgi:hypothetical protein